MNFTLSSKLKREVDAAMKDAVAGKTQAVVDRLCGVLGYPVAPQAKHVRSEERLLKARIAILETALANAQAQAATTVSTSEMTIDTRPVRSLPKPTKRHVDRDLLAEFREKFPTCCVRGCGQDADPHHLIRRSEGGSDAHENLAPPCLHHHTGREGWHTLTPDVWVPKYSARIPNLVRCKIRLALETLAERKAPAIEAEA